MSEYQGGARGRTILVSKPSITQRVGIVLPTGSVPKGSIHSHLVAQTKRLPAGSASQPGTVLYYRAKYGKIPRGSGFIPGTEFFTDEEWASVQAKEAGGQKTVYVEPGVPIKEAGGAQIDVEGQAIESGGVKYVAQKGKSSSTSTRAEVQPKDTSSWIKTISRVPTEVVGTITTKGTDTTRELIAQFSSDVFSRTVAPYSSSKFVPKERRYFEQETAAASYAAKLKKAGYTDVDWYRKGDEYFFTGKTTAPEGYVFTGDAGEKTEEITSPVIPKSMSAVKSLYAARGDVIETAPREKGISFFVPSSPLTEAERESITQELSEKRLLLESGLLSFKPEKHAEIQARVSELSFKLLGAEQASISPERIELELERRAVVETPVSYKGFNWVTGELPSFEYAPERRAERVAMFEQTYGTGGVGRNITEESLKFAKTTAPPGAFAAGFLGGTTGMTLSAPYDISRTGFEVREALEIGGLSMLGKRAVLFGKEMTLGVKESPAFSVGALAGSIALGKGFGRVSKRFLTSEASLDLARAEGRLALVEDAFVSTSREGWFRAIGEGLFDVSGKKARVSGALVYSTDIKIEPPVVVTPKTIFRAVTEYKDLLGRRKIIVSGGEGGSVVTPITGKPSGFVEPPAGMPAFGAGAVTPSFKSVIPARASELTALPKSFNVVKWKGVDIRLFKDPLYEVVKAGKQAAGREIEYYGVAFDKGKRVVLGAGEAHKVPFGVVSEVRGAGGKPFAEFHTHPKGGAGFPSQPDVNLLQTEKFGRAFVFGEKEFSVFYKKPEALMLAEHEVYKTFKGKKITVYDAINIWEKHGVVKRLDYSELLSPRAGITAPRVKAGDFVYKARGGEEAFGAVAGKTSFSFPESLVGREFETGARFVRKGTIDLGDIAVTDFSGKAYSFEALPKVKKAVESPFKARQVVKASEIEGELARVAKKQRVESEVTLSADKAGSVSTQLEQARLKAQVETAKQLPRVGGGELVEALKQQAIIEIEAREAKTLGNVVSAGGGALVLSKQSMAKQSKTGLVGVPKQFKSSLSRAEATQQFQLLRAAPETRGELSVVSRFKPMVKGSGITRVVPESREDLRAVTRLEPRIKGGEDVREVSVLRAVNVPRALQAPRAFSEPRGRVIPREIGLSIPRLSLGLRGLTRVSEAGLTELRTKEVPAPRPIKPPTPFIPVPITPTSSKGVSREKSERVLNLAYDVLVKRRGKWRTLKKKLPKGLALRAGEEYTLKTLGASFKVIAVGETKMKDVPYAPKKDVFRSFKIVKGKRVPLKDTFIQRRGKRLVTGSEREEIKKAKKEAGWFKKKGGWF